MVDFRAAPKIFMFGGAARTPSRKKSPRVHSHETGRVVMRKSGDKRGYEVVGERIAIHLGGANYEESAVGEDVPDVHGEPRVNGAVR